MPCQCASTTEVVREIDTIHTGCECASEASTDCGCADAPTPSDREGALERVVMELDKRLRKLEASR